MESLHSFTLPSPSDFSYSRAVPQSRILFPHVFCWEPPGPPCELVFHKIPVALGDYRREVVKYVFTDRTLLIVRWSNRSFRHTSRAASLRQRAEPIWKPHSGCGGLVVNRHSVQPVFFSFAVRSRLSRSCFSPSRRSISLTNAISLSASCSTAAWAHNVCQSSSFSPFNLGS